ncbi:MAG: hypothetical protein KDA28_11270 [Phycisphaerales bacterium]|nr:hypothetical protein [Phycisphaerales bacterium]
MSSTSRSLLALVTLSMSSCLALGDDLSPPPWRGSAGTTFQHWGFDQPGSVGPPDNGLHNPYGTPLFKPDPGATWDPVDPSGQRFGTYVIQQNQMLNFEIPNDGQPNGQKELWLQYVFTTIDGFVPQSSVLDTSSGTPFTLLSSTATDLGGGLYHVLDVFTLGSCPPSELVRLAPGTINSPAWIDQVVVDTRCVTIPAPGALGLLGIGGLMTTRPRRSS